jgi:hypothetical protein
MDDRHNLLNQSHLYRPPIKWSIFKSQGTGVWLRLEHRNHRTRLIFTVGHFISPLGWPVKWPTVNVGPKGSLKTPNLITQTTDFQSAGLLTPGSHECLVNIEQCTVLPVPQTGGGNTGVTCCRK